MADGNAMVTVSGNGYTVKNSCLDVNIDVSQVADLSVSGRAHALRASLVPSQQPWLMLDCDHVVFFSRCSSYFIIVSYQNSKCR